MKSYGSGIRVENGHYRSNSNIGESLEWIASELVHDSWHRQLYKSSYESQTLVSIKMVVAYFVVMISVTFWVGIPMYYRLTNLLERIK